MNPGLSSGKDTTEKANELSKKICPTQKSDNPKNIYRSIFSNRV